MERLTTNKDVSEMGMFELAHNSYYYKDGVARYRDFENDIDARELTRQLLKNYADGDDAFVDDDDFDEEMLELLMHGTSTIEGLIAIFYRNLWAMADLRERLKEYEDLEEQGLLLRLPCKVGSTVYAICTCEAVGTVLDGTLYGSNGGFGTATGYYCPYELSDKCPHIDADDCDECKNIESVFEDTIDYINITGYEILIGLKNTNLCVTIDEIGKTVFLTQTEAEQKLKEMEGGNNGTMEQKHSTKM